MEELRRAKEEAAHLDNNQSVESNIDDRKNNSGQIQ